MNANILARETYEMLHLYPTREYPEVEPVDPKTGKPLKDKGGKDKKGAPKKKKKKEPPFPLPTWAIELEDVQKTVKQIKDLVARAEELHLEPDFLAQVDLELKRFHMEINFRKMRDEEDRLEAEAKALAKKKKKK